MGHFKRATSRGGSFQASRLGSFLASAEGLGCLTSLGCGERVFACETHSQCRLDGQQGRCEHAGYCSYAEDSCESGFAYHEHGASELANACVTELIDHFELDSGFILEVEGRFGSVQDFDLAEQDRADAQYVPDDRRGAT